MTIKIEDQFIYAQMKNSCTDILRRTKAQNKLTIN